MTVVPLLTSLLTIPSPTGDEYAKNQYIVDWIAANVPAAMIEVSSDGVMVRLNNDPSQPHIGLVGHSDVVPDHVVPYVDGDRLYGSGASDMQSGLACIIYLLKELSDQPVNISLIIYNREEGTPINENGLYALIRDNLDQFKSMALAIVAEPTNNTIQLGCVGSIHAQVEIAGKQAHSARPWDGDNALYKAIPFIQAIKSMKRVKQSIYGVDFYDVINITESCSEVGRTTIPGRWTANVNFRYAPIRSDDEAQDELLALLHQAEPSAIVKITDNSYAGEVIESVLLNEWIDRLGRPKEAKQAWTDVAQLSRLGVPAFNFGPGLTSQAHRVDEFVLISDIELYYKTLLGAFT